MARRGQNKLGKVAHTSSKIDYKLGENLAQQARNVAQSQVKPLHKAVDVDLGGGS